jgi:LuxR family maltose regulon positive regulatory protein
MMRARVLIAQNNPGEAMQLLSPQLEPLEAAGRTRSLIEVLALQAIALQVQGRVSQALTALAHALSLAEPEGYVRLFVDEGKPMAQLLRKMKAGDRELKAYVYRLLAAFEMAESKPVTFSSRKETTAGYPLIEPLSKRELEVLQLIAKGCSNKEIASQLFITISTVKRHTVTIYRKLDVENRTQAVAQARELELL